MAPAHLVVRVITEFKGKLFQRLAILFNIRLKLAFRLVLQNIVRENYFHTRLTIFQIEVFR